MTKVKLDGSVGGSAASAIEEWIPTLYHRPGIRVVGLVELVHVERTQPAPDSDKEPVVRMRISSLELAGRDQEAAVRNALRALYVQRTASGTLDAAGEVELSKGTLKDLTEEVTFREVCRLRAGLEQWEARARRAAGTGKDLTAGEFRHELRAVAEGLQVLLDRAAAGRPTADGS